MRLPRLLPGLLAAVAAGLVLVAVTATNSVPATHAGRSLTSRVPTANELKPAACAALNLTTVVTGSGTVNGGNSADLVLGSAAIDALNGKNSTDCLVGGEGNDTLDGGNGNDVCIGGAGVDLFVNCETQIQ